MRWTELLLFYVEKDQIVQVFRIEHAETALFIIVGQIQHVDEPVLVFVH